MFEQADQPIWTRLTAVVAALILAMGLTTPAVAAQGEDGGEPSQKACHGQLIAEIARDFGITPPQLVEIDPRASNVRDVHQLIKAFCANPPPGDPD